MSPLWRASQPVALPPERKSAPIYGDEPIGEQERAWYYNDGWNAYRAAMIAAADAQQRVATRANVSSNETKQEIQNGQ